MDLETRRGQVESEISLLQQERVRLTMMTRQVDARLQQLAGQRQLLAEQLREQLPADPELAP